VAAELRWSGWASTSPAFGREDWGGEALSKRGGQWGHDGAYRGAGVTMVRRHKDSVAAAVRLASADTRPRKERRGRQIARARAREGG
jgi:hypothetical protein